MSIVWTALERKMIWASLAVCLTLGRPGWNSEDPAKADPPLDRPAVPAAERMNTYRHCYDDGLYSTIVGIINVGAPEIKNLKKMKLKIPGFKKDFSVRYILQEHRAPLVVVLVGVDGLADTPLGRLLPWWLNDAGFHVLTFDSTFVPSFADCSRTGVTGNLDAECLDMGKVIQEFLKKPEVAKVVTQTGLVGYSLGGTQALILSKLSAEKKLPFEITGALALSPLIKLKSTAELMDDFYKTDRWKYTMIDMAKTFMTHDPVAPGEKIPFEPEFMRAGIGYIIREEFTDIVDRNDQIFRLNKLPDEAKMEAGVNRREDARAWGFVRFMEQMCYPYWKEKAGYKTPDDLWNTADLTRIMKNLPAYAHAIVCEDDPLNAPADLAELRGNVPASQLIVIPHGGHLGYMGSHWCCSHVMRIFGSP